MSFVPTSGMRAAARRGIKLVNEGRAGDGLESATITRARKIAEGKPLTPDHAKRMHSFFSRHAVDRKADWSKAGKETPGYTAHMLWGGDSGAAWAHKVVKKIASGNSGK